MTFLIYMFCGVKIEFRDFGEIYLDCVWQRRIYKMKFNNAYEEIPFIITLEEKY